MFTQKWLKSTYFRQNFGMVTRKSDTYIEIRVKISTIESFFEWKYHSPYDTIRNFWRNFAIFFLKCTKDNQLAAWRAELDQSGRRKLTKRELNDCQEIVSLFFGNFWPFSSRAILPIIRGILKNSFFDRSFLAYFAWFSCYF